MENYKSKDRCRILLLNVFYFILHFGIYASNPFSIKKAASIEAAFFIIYY